VIEALRDGAQEMLSHASQLSVITLTGVIGSALR
jgi:hypothetical protein